MLSTQVAQVLGIKGIHMILAKPHLFLIIIGGAEWYTPDGATEISRDIYIYIYNIYVFSSNEISLSITRCR